MDLNIEEIVAFWKIDESRYKNLGNIVSEYLKREISKLGILPEISFRTKELLSIIKKIKKKQREKPYSYADLNDKLGIRIICNFQEDTEIVDKFLTEKFTIKKAEYKKADLNYDRLDYISNHYDASIMIDKIGVTSIRDYKDLIFEIQVRTLNQHAWSNAAHSLSYKQEAELAPPLKRKVYRLLSLYEIADDEFSSVNKTLLNYPENKVYSLLRKLESKIYRFAQVDYDRETSLDAFKVLLNFLSANDQERVFLEIDQFVEDNSSKIEFIFSSNRIRYHEIPILTQPEIFFIWFGLEKFPFSIEDNWSNEFDVLELEQIKALWGRSV